jgi:hypothetical protein
VYFVKAPVEPARQYPQQYPPTVLLPLQVVAWSEALPIDGATVQAFNVKLATAGVTFPLASHVNSSVVGDMV